MGWKTRTENLPTIVEASYDDGDVLRAEASDDDIGFSIEDSATVFVPKTELRALIEFLESQAKG